MDTVVKKYCDSCPFYKSVYTGTINKDVCGLENRLIETEEDGSENVVVPKWCLRNEHDIIVPKHK